MALENLQRDNGRLRERMAEEAKREEAQFERLCGALIAAAVVWDMHRRGRSGHDRDVREQLKPFVLLCKKCGWAVCRCKRRATADELEE